MDYQKLLNYSFWWDDEQKQIRHLGDYGVEINENNKELTSEHYDVLYLLDKDKGLQRLLDKDVAIPVNDSEYEIKLFDKVCKVRFGSVDKDQARAFQKRMRIPSWEIYDLLLRPQVPQPGVPVNQIAKLDSLLLETMRQTHKTQIDVLVDLKVESGNLNLVGVYLYFAENCGGIADWRTVQERANKGGALLGSIVQRAKTWFEAATWYSSHNRAISKIDLYNVEMNSSAIADKPSHMTDGVWKLLLNGGCAFEFKLIIK
jgi:hypothetical protein